MLLSAIKIAYKDLIVAHEKDVHFWMFISFLPSFTIIRLYTYFLTFGPPNIFVEIYDIHIHHLTFGIVALAIIGYLSLTVRTKKSRLILSILYGIGLAFTFDEFGMWLKLEDDYWSRLSYDAILIISLWFINTVYFYKFWLHFFKHFFSKEKAEIKISSSQT